MTSHTLPHAVSGLDKGLGSQPCPPTTRSPVAQALTTDKGGHNMINFIKDIEFYHKGYMALNNISIFHGQAMLFNGNSPIFTTEAH